MGWIGIGNTHFFKKCLVRLSIQQFLIGQMQYRVGAQGFTPLQGVRDSIKNSCPRYFSDSAIVKTDKTFSVLPKSA
jgi:hypothetical protein